MSTSSGFAARLMAMSFIIALRLWLSDVKKILIFVRSPFFRHTRVLRSVYIGPAVLKGIQLLRSIYIYRGSRCPQRSGVGVYCRVDSSARPARSPRNWSASAPGPVCCRILFGGGGVMRRGGGGGTRLHTRRRCVNPTETGLSSLSDRSEGSVARSGTSMPQGCPRHRPPSARPHQATRARRWLGPSTGAAPLRP